MKRKEDTISINNLKNTNNHGKQKNQPIKMKEDIVTREKIDKYRKISEKALSLAKKNISKGKEQEAKEIIEMVECYLSDSKHFEKQGNLVNAFAAINYAHGWLDSGARLRIFNVTDRKLFTIC
ncbi:MAG: DUF357 domain-containing protein [Nanoarchaeota archaeon]